MIYVASPYSDDEAIVRNARFNAVQDYVVNNQERFDELLYSPIMYWHKVAVDYKLKTDAASWWKLNVDMLESASRLIVFTLPGWEISKGVRMEIDWWKANKDTDWEIDDDPYEI